MISTLATPSIGARISIAAATAFTLTVGTMAPPAPPLPDVSVPRVVTQSVALTANPFEQLWAIASGADPESPLPPGVSPIAPVAEQFVRNLVSYGGELVAGQGDQIPDQISARIENVGTVLQTVPDRLANSVAVIPSAVAGGALLGLFAGGIAGGSIGQVLFPNAEPESPGAFVAYVGTIIGGYVGLVVGAAVGLAVTPVFWVADALRFRNSLATALAPEEQAAPSPEPAGVAAATLVDQKPHVTTRNLTAPEPPAFRNTIVSAPEVPSLRPETPPAAPTDTPVVAAEPTVGPVDARPDRSELASKWRAVTKRIASAVKVKAESKVSSSPASDETVAGPPAATGSTENKRSLAGAHRSHQKSVSKPAP
jgi:hypothetical protein